MCKTTRQQLIERAAQLGVTLRDSGDAISADTPRWQVLGTTGLHSTTIELRGWKRADAYAEMLDDLSMGLTPCDDPACEYCCSPVPEAEMDRMYGRRIGGAA